MGHVTPEMDTECLGHFSEETLATGSPARHCLGDRRGLPPRNGDYSSRVAGESSRSSSPNWFAGNQ